MSLRKVLYTAEASTDGGREGVVRSSDGRLEVSLSVPVELRGAGGDGTNPSNSSRPGTQPAISRPFSSSLPDARLTSPARGSQFEWVWARPAPVAWAWRCSLTSTPPRSARTTRPP